MARTIIATILDTTPGNSPTTQHQFAPPSRALDAKLANPRDLRTKTLRRLILVVCLAMPAAPAWSQSSIEKIKTDYRTVRSKLDKHFVGYSGDAWIDDDPESSRLLAQQWSLAGEWVAAWLNAHPHTGAKGVRDALKKLAPSSKPQYLVLDATTVLVVSPSPIGNVFIVSKSGNAYRVA
jgi:hypothetical protein